MAGNGDMTIENSTTLDELIEQSTARLTLSDLKGAVTELWTAFSSID